MENWYFILVPVVLISVVLVFKFFKMEQDYKSKSKEIQQKIEELKLKNASLNTMNYNKMDMDFFNNEVLELHKSVINKYLK